MTAKAKFVSTKMVDMMGLDPIVSKNEHSKESFLYQSTMRNDSCANVCTPEDRGDIDKLQQKQLLFDLMEQNLVPEEQMELDASPKRHMTVHSQPESPITRPVNKF